MMGLAGSGLMVLVALAVTHDQHGCREPAHVSGPCLCAPQVGVPYQPSVSTYRRPPWHPRPYPIAPQYVAPPSYVSGGHRGYAPNIAGYVEGPPIYVDAPPVYVEPAQIYIERPQIIVRPSEVIMAPPEIHYEPCPDGEVCLESSAATVTDRPSDH